MRRATLRYTPWRRLAYLISSVLANKMDGSFAKIGTIDYHYWAKRKTFLLASRNVSDCKQKTFYLRVETILFAGRKYENWKYRGKTHYNCRFFGTKELPNLRDDGLYLTQISVNCRKPLGRWPKGLKSMDPALGHGKRPCEMLNYVAFGPYGRRTSFQHDTIAVKRVFG